MDYKLTIEGAEIRRKYLIHLVDSVIIATAQRLDFPVVSGNPHFKKVKEVQTRWIK